MKIVAGGDFCWLHGRMHLHSPASLFTVPLLCQAVRVCITEITVPGLALSIGVLCGAAQDLKCLVFSLMSSHFKINPIQR